jgi:hypothetical protein
VIVVWIAEINRAVVFTENSVVVKIAGSIAVDKRIIPVGFCSNIIKDSITGNDKNNGCRN